MATTVLLSMIAVVAACWDWQTRRLPNWLTIGTTSLGVALSALPGGLSIPSALLGGLVGFALGMTAFATGILGAGDGKYLMALGTFFGPVQLLYAILAMAVAGGILAIVEAARQGTLWVTILRAGAGLKQHNQFALLGQRRFAPFFVTQLLGAFNDNVFRNATLVLITALMGLSQAQQSTYTNLAPALFILPFFFFSATAGQLAEKYEKTRIIKAVKLFEIVAMALAAYGFWTHQAGLLLVVLFLMGLHSTVFGPIKYSILPQALKPEELTGGNGLVEMGTSMSILSGMIVGGLVFTVAGSHGTVVAACAIIALAICGNIAARLIPKVDAGDPNLKINWNPLPESLAVLRMARQQKAVRNSILGVSWFWFVGTVLTSQLPAYAVTNLGGQPTLYIFALALFSVGTGVGSLLCEKLSARTVEIGLVPLGAFGMTAFLLDLYFARSGEATVHGLTIGPFLQQPGSIRIVIDLVGIGLFTGIFVVPLFALIQSRTPKAQMSL